MRIGITGTGFAGRAPARLAVRHACDVMLSDFRDPATLPGTMLRCRVGTANDAAAFGDVVLIAAPLARHRDIPPELLDGKLVLHASDYDPKSDGRIPELGNHVTTASELVARHFAGAHVVKALNAIPENEIERDARPSGAPARRARPIAGDADRAKAVVVDLLDLLRGSDALTQALAAAGERT